MLCFDACRGSHLPLDARRGAQLPPGARRGAQLPARRVPRLERRWWVFYVAAGVVLCLGFACGMAVVAAVLHGRKRASIEAAADEGWGEKRLALEDAEAPRSPEAPTPPRPPGRPSLASPSPGEVKEDPEESECALGAGGVVVFPRFRALASNRCLSALIEE